MLPDDETARLAALEAFGILDTAPDLSFDQLVNLAQELFEVPIALVSLVAEQRQWFKACAGLEASETSREVSFCSHAVTARKPLVVPDTLDDSRFQHNPLVTGEPGIRFYAGHPLYPDGAHALGTLCLIDTKPRGFSKREQRLLAMLASQAEALLRKHQMKVIQQAQQQELLEVNQRLTAASARLAKEQQLLRAILDGSRDPIYARSRSGRYLAANTACMTLLAGSSSSTALEELTGMVPATVQASIDAAEAEVVASGLPQRQDLMEVIEDRHGRGSTLIASQLPIEHWHDYIGAATVADAILDRLLHSAHRLTLRGESMRKSAAPQAAEVDPS